MHPQIIKTLKYTSRCTESLTAGLITRPVKIQTSNGFSHRSDIILDPSSSALVDRETSSRANQLSLILFYLKRAAVFLCHASHKNTHQSSSDQICSNHSEPTSSPLLGDVIRHSSCLEGCSGDLEAMLKH